MKDNNAKRLDLYLTETRGYSRSYSREIIKGGKIEINGKTTLKPSFPVSETDSVAVFADNMKYVGRGGYKLEKALGCFDIDLRGLICADIGASTGGFTDCMLQNGAAAVYAVENGSLQLADKLRGDPRVFSLENTDIRGIFSLGAEIAFAAIDLSFIPVASVLGNLFALLSPEASAVILIKPQYESGLGLVGRRGALLDRRLHKKICAKVIADVEAARFSINGFTYSPIAGKNGNIEYLAFCAKGREPPGSPDVSIEKTVDEAFSKAKSADLR